MVSKGLKRALAIILALSSFLVSSPSAAAPVSVRSFAQQHLRVATIAYDISVATAAECRAPQMVTGLLLHDLTAYHRNVRMAVSRAFSLDTGIGIIQIVPGSVADRAGLRIDDEILSVDGISVEDTDAMTQPRRSSRRAEKFTRVLQSALRDGPAELTIRRQGAIVEKILTPQLGCGGEVALLRSRRLNAWSDGNRVIVTTSMMKMARSDHELAFVIAHEMAHNNLGHSEHSRRGIFGMKLGGKRQELAADYMAVWLMTQGGYKAAGGIGFLSSARRRLWWAVSLDHPGFGRRIKLVAGAIKSAEGSPVWERANAAAPDTLATDVPQSQALALGSTPLPQFDPPPSEPIATEMRPEVSADRGGP